MSDPDVPKSALELVMERLRKKDAESGVEAHHLTDDQKAAIAEARSVYAERAAAMLPVERDEVQSRPGLQHRHFDMANELPELLRHPRRARSAT